MILLHDQFYFTKVVSRFMPNQLSENQKAERVKICHETHGGFIILTHVRRFRKKFFFSYCTSFFMEYIYLFI